MSVPGKNPLPVIGYADRLTVRPGEKIKFMVSCDFRNYRADLVRMLHADNNKIGPGLKVVPVETVVTGVYRGKKEGYPQGSYVIVKECSGLRPKARTDYSGLGDAHQTQKGTPGSDSQMGRRVGVRSLREPERKAGARPEESRADKMG